MEFFSVPKFSELLIELFYTNRVFLMVSIVNTQQLIVVPKYD